MVLFELVMSLGMIGVLLPCLLCGLQQARASLHACRVTRQALVLLPELQQRLLESAMQTHGQARCSVPVQVTGCAEEQLGRLELQWQGGEFVADCRFRWLWQGQCRLEWQQVFYLAGESLPHEN